MPHATRPDASGTFPERLQWLVAFVEKTKGWSSREFCRRAGIEQSYLSVYFHRVAKKPGTDVMREHLVKLSKAGEVSLLWLAAGEGSPHDPSATHSELREETIAMAPHLAGGVDNHIVNAAIAGLRASRVPAHDDDPDYWRDRFLRLTVDAQEFARRIAEIAHDRPAPVAHLPPPKKRGS